MSILLNQTIKPQEITELTAALETENNTKAARDRFLLSERKFKASFYSAASSTCVFSLWVYLSKCLGQADVKKTLILSKKPRLPVFKHLLMILLMFFIYFPLCKAKICIPALFRMWMNVLFCVVTDLMNKPQKKCSVRYEKPLHSDKLKLALNWKANNANTNTNTDIYSTSFNNVFFHTGLPSLAFLKTLIMKIVLSVRTLR